MKRLRPEASACIKGHGGLDTAIDDVIISAYNITDDEYDRSKGEMISIRTFDDNRPLYLAFENKTVKT